MYKLIAFDMDGTLLQSDKSIAETSLSSIKDAFQNGKEVVLATGRPKSELHMYQKELANIRYGILESGAIVYDFVNDKVLMKEVIPKDISDKVYDIVQTNDVMVVLMIDGQGYIQQDHFDHIGDYHMSIYEDLYQDSAIFLDEILPNMETEAGQFEKINLYFKTNALRDYYYKVLINENVTLAKAEETGIEITARGVEKGQGLKKLCQILGYSIVEAIAVGDADNDESMIRDAGLGVAMANANQNIKNVADVIVASNDNGGIQEVIEKFLLKS
ncbi:Cof-type HAD-IIB family hydrolase [Streptococcus uberis]|uniref:Cof-type HAD-IIB family hydrolase n=1 Tax=Streptococcus uberis TaxID=1349 RepID=UPI00214FE41E|nr:Cof-type HAD-IIB family hydrolase [Streptococcus uberis]MCR4254222.1 Cof-type HAD-IIB family hydrolase [Streptococcus uberis]MCR4256017.1 Cof-type HAD-IIB family hydrolase [Streptococcus uberis]MCR4260180.1 Cof-type HAD-IIB family hydrolase [Streptococcus uberis]MCR4262336.1 Cof-type HAD-IIB family hydrolase [Streptococcus uberis]